MTEPLHFGHDALLDRDVFRLERPEERLPGRQTVQTSDAKVSARLQKDPPIAGTSAGTGAPRLSQRSMTS